ncbi:hypothetical protein DSM106972_095010 [Dulcicalothrix desertica PCC 7102]|uniref:Uncharacterized protein n=2 Tax=Dulcicalothrix desertica TaxID=32056 RepID=A0A3S1A5C8_9CYAN|nr:hypothetical protein DSM106972_095010 [Dulcicalothrix desertica PCC 7102]TWH62628.1 hypothetical protein CAL7102_00125 [Dulcicalothrix desertica PCC 7102]
MQLIFARLLISHFTIGVIVNYINQAILENLRFGGKTSEALKNTFNCSYSVLDQALRARRDASEIEISWSADNNHVRIYKLKHK